MIYDLIIIGGGPAGVAAGIYAARKKIKCLLIAENIGGQPIIAGEINNFIGTKFVSGVDFAKMLSEHLYAQEGIEIKEGFKVKKIEKKSENFSISINQEESFETKTILIALGSNPRRLQIPGEDKFEGRGVFYCSICDAPLMKNKTAVVIGGGNSGIYAIMDLIPYASKIYLFEYGDAIKADPVYLDKINASGKVEIITMAKAVEVFGETLVSGIKYEDRRSGEIKEIKTDGIFVSIGYQSNSGLVKDLVEINEAGKIVVNSKTQETSLEGIWAAGDVTDVLYNQINIAIGDAVKAALNIYGYLKKISH